MELISLHEDPEKVRAIDKMVDNGAFGSRAEVYRTGAYLLLTLSEARRLVMVDKLDSVLVGRKVKTIIESINNHRLDEARVGLLWIAEGLRLRAILSPLLGQPELRDSYETVADSFFSYSEVLRDISKYEDLTKKRILSDLRRDIIALPDSMTFRAEEKEPTAFRTGIEFGHMNYITQPSFHGDIFVASGHAQLSNQLKELQLEKYTMKKTRSRLDVEIFAKFKVKDYLTEIFSPSQRENSEPVIVMSNV